MANPGTRDELNILITTEWVNSRRVKNSQESADLRVDRERLCKHVVEVGKSGDIDLILSTERAFLENDWGRYSNSPAMANSLSAALAELASAEGHVEKVRDPSAYKAVNESHALPKNRIGQVPRDEARQFFRSHAARLLNQDKARLDAEEKAIVNARKSNMRAGEKLYAKLQDKALGLDKGKSRGPDLSM